MCTTTAQLPMGTQTIPTETIQERAFSVKFIWKEKNNWLNSQEKKLEDMVITQIAQS